MKESVKEINENVLNLSLLTGNIEELIEFIPYYTDSQINQIIHSFIKKPRGFLNSSGKTQDLVNNVSLVPIDGYLFLWNLLVKNRMPKKYLNYFIKDSFISHNEKSREIFFKEIRFLYFDLTSVKYDLERKLLGFLPHANNYINSISIGYGLYPKEFQNNFFRIVCDYLRKQTFKKALLSYKVIEQIASASFYFDTEKAKPYNTQVKQVFENLRDIFEEKVKDLTNQELIAIYWKIKSTNKGYKRLVAEIMRKEMIQRGVYREYKP